MSPAHVITVVKRRR